LHWLDEALRETACALHAYCLMTNHIHLLLTPTDAQALPRLLISLGRRYVQYINRTYRRSGTLWPLLRVPAPAAFVPPCTSGRTLQGEPHRGGTLSFDLLSLH
jgi:REP element-mobilizing transposase RayT